MGLTARLFPEIIIRYIFCCGQLLEHKMIQLLDMTETTSHQ